MPASHEADLAAAFGKVLPAGVDHRPDYRVFIVIDSFTLYRNTLDSANTAYDRMLVTTAYSIGDSLRIDNRRLQIPVSYAALEVHEAEYSTRMIYRINELDGSFLAGDRDLPAFSAKSKSWPTAPTLLEIYESRYGNAPVRVVAVFQPLPSLALGGRTMARSSRLPSRSKTGPTLYARSCSAR